MFDPKLGKKTVFANTVYSVPVNKIPHIVGVVRETDCGPFLAFALAGDAAKIFTRPCPAVDTLAFSVGTVAVILALTHSG